ncbi:MAG: hypothetical protein K2G67_01425 [Muribaculaceae bacterium]|nr:hypothetical protein [Muribaculaceae bacterium]
MRTTTMRLSCISAMLCISGCVSFINAQTSFEEYRRKAQEEFNQYRDKANAEFEAYRQRVNAEFTDYMRQAWEKFNAEPGTPVPPSPEPPKPEEAKPDQKPKDEALPFKKLKPLDRRAPKPTPLLPDEAPKLPKEKPSEPKEKPVQPKEKPVKPTPRPNPGPEITFSFYGNEYSVPFSNELRISLRGIDENSVADAWSRLLGNKSVELVRKCVELRDQLRLPDWGYAQLIEKIGDAAFPGKKSESNLLQMFLLTQSGYKVRIGRINNRIIMLMPFKETLYNYTFIPIDGVNYYMIDRSAGLGPVYMYNRSFPKEQVVSLSIEEQPAFGIKSSESRNFESGYGPGIQADITINKNLIDFYNDYPRSNRWDLYANASLSNELKKQLYPVLKSAINGRDQQDAANILLRFVQKAFDYKTDQEQFGEERAFFPDETFYYPYSDCEDRAILYSNLVRDLLGLKVVLVHYPGHLATAVKFDTPLEGDHFMIDGEKFVVCDPTYINSSIGMAMPSYKGSSAEIVRL